MVAVRFIEVFAQCFGDTFKHTR